MARFFGKVGQIVSQIFANVSQILITSTLEMISFQYFSLKVRWGRPRREMMNKRVFTTSAAVGSCLIIGFF